MRITEGDIQGLRRDMQGGTYHLHQAVNITIGGLGRRLRAEHADRMDETEIMERRDRWKRPGIDKVKKL